MEGVQGSGFPYSVFDRVEYTSDERQMPEMVANVVEWFFSMPFLGSTKVITAQKNDDTNKYAISVTEQVKEEFTILDFGRILLIGFLCATWIPFLVIIALFVGSRVYRGRVIGLEGSTE